MFIPVMTSIGFSIPFGTGCGGSVGAIFGPIGFFGGICVGSIIGYIVNVCIKDRFREYDLSFTSQAISKFDHDYNRFEQTESENGEKSKEDNLPKSGSIPFIPPKTKDGKIPKNKNGAYIDDKGNEWKWDPRKS